MRVLLAATWMSAAMWAQESAPTFRATTRLVEFSFVALDKGGAPVTDLRADEVQVEEKGQRRKLEFFRFEGAGAAVGAQKAAVLPPGLFSNRVEVLGGPPRNVTALVLDTLNTAPGDTVWVRAQLTRYLKALAPETRVAVYHLGSQLSILQDFTGDGAELRARIEKAGLALPQQQATDLDATVRDAEEMLRIFNNNPSVLEILTMQIENEQQYNATVRQRKMELTLAALETLGRHLAGVPGRKNLVWIGGGISMVSITGAMGFGARGGIRSYENDIRSSAQRLAQNGVAVYFVNARGLQGDGGYSAAVGGVTAQSGRGRFERQQQAEAISADPFPAASAIAGITGGRVIQNSNDPGEGLRRATADVRGAYSAGFYVGEEPDGKWHGWKIRVTRPGVRVESRMGYLAEKPAKDGTRWTAEEWRAAIYNPAPSTALVVDARCEGLTGEKAGQVSLLAQVEPAGLTFERRGAGARARLEICVAEKAPTGEVEVHTEDGVVEAPDGDLTKVTVEAARYLRVWAPKAGARTIRVIIRDAGSGRYGVVDIPVAVIPHYGAGAK